MSVRLPFRLGFALTLFACGGGVGAGGKCTRTSDCSNGLVCVDQTCAPSTLDDLLCGNASVDPAETCDDGNTSDGDGCSANCLIETVPPACGNGLRDPAETCDDGNAVGADGCSETCAVEFGFVCSEGTPNVCHPACGNGKLDPGEGCDDGNIASGDGCSASCFGEVTKTCAGEPSVCLDIPIPPVVTGETSSCAGTNGGCQFEWTTPAGAVSFRVREDNGIAIDKTSTQHFQLTPVFPSAAMSLSVQACNAQGGCSEPSSVTTPITNHLQINPKDGRHFFRQAAHVVTRTQIGNIAAVVCNSCTLTTSDADVPLADAKARIARALNQKADVIELNVVRIAGELHVSKQDDVNPGVRPRLDDVLQDPVLRNASSLIALDIVESDNDTTPDLFARQLLTLLDANRILVRNGRPLFIRASTANNDHLAALRTLIANFPFLQDYVRFHRVLTLGGVTLAQNGVNAIASAATEGLNGVEFDYRSPNLLSLVAETHRRGLLAGVYDVPGPGQGGFGDVWLATLRNEVDWISTNYRDDHARDIICEQTDVMYLALRDTPSATTTFRATTTLPSASPSFLNYQFTSLVLNDPDLAAPPSNFIPELTATSAMVGKSLNMTDTLPARAVPTFVHNFATNSNSGYLVAAHVKFDDLTLNTNQTMAIVNKSQTAGFALELSNPSGTGSVLRFGIFPEGGSAFSFHSFPVGGGVQLLNACGSGQSSAQVFNGALSTTRSHLVVGVYEGDGRVMLMIDGMCAGVVSAPTLAAETASTSNKIRITIGADPDEPGVSPDVVSADSPFDGLIQQAETQVWKSHASDANRDSTGAAIRSTSCPTTLPSGLPPL
jgi:cysteine-rich repeat protein